MIQDLVDANGTMTLADLANYYVAPRAPLNTTYRGRTVLTGQAPSSGPVLLFLLNVLEGYTLAGGENSVVTYHRYAQPPSNNLFRRGPHLRNGMRGRVRAGSSRP